MFLLVSQVFFSLVSFLFLFSASLGCQNRLMKRSTLWRPWVRLRKISDGDDHGLGRVPERVGVENRRMACRP